MKGKSMSLAPDRLAIGISRHFTTAGRHPYDQVVWEKVKKKRIKVSIMIKAI